MKQITCVHCGDTYPDFDVAHVCSKGPYAPKLKPRMNKRIRELEDLAGYIQVDDRFSGGYITFNTEKFAELIVRECLGIVHDAERGGSNEIWDNAVKFIRRDLQEHFGVEE